MSRLKVEIDNSMSVVHELKHEDKDFIIIDMDSLCDKRKEIIKNHKTKIFAITQPYKINYVGKLEYAKYTPDIHKCLREATKIIQLTQQGFSVVIDNLFKQGLFLACMVRFLRGWRAWYHFKYNIILNFKKAHKEYVKEMSDGYFVNNYNESYFRNCIRSLDISSLDHDFLKQKRKNRLVDIYEINNV